ncbi:hypothetical protein IPM62_01250 [Candidatus Woesebacteria bacterium]|nr:MAG: hypothetical protein IPM62_01250 [Candidatus Woesebacteria bacterium]
MSQELLRPRDSGFSRREIDMIYQNIGVEGRTRREIDNKGVDVIIPPDLSGEIRDAMMNIFICISRPNDICDQLTDTMGILSKSLVINRHNLLDLELYWRSQLGLQKLVLESERGEQNAAEIFARTADNGVKLGFFQEGDVGNWICSIGGMAIIDPLTIRSMFAEDKKVTELEGLTRFGFAIDEHEAAYDQDPEMINFARFIQNIPKELHDRHMTVDSGLARTAQSAMQLLSEDFDLEHARVIRPAPPEHIIPLLALGLADILTWESWSEIDVKETAYRMARAIRRRRSSVEFVDLLTITLGFVEKEKANSGVLANISLHGKKIDSKHVGSGLTKVTDLLGDRHGNEQICKKIGRNIVPEIVYQMRLEGWADDRLWTSEVYKALGISQVVFNNHTRKLRDLEKIPGHEIVGTKGVVAIIYGQFEPMTAAHTELIIEVAHCLPEFVNETRETTWLGLGVNSGNPRKRHEKSVGIRRNMVQKSLMGIGDGIFMWPENDVYGPTAQRLTQHKQRFGPRVKVVRACGMDSLSNNMKYENHQDGVYDDDADYLNKQRYIWFLQKADINQTPNLLLIKLGELFANFPDSMVLVCPMPELHSSYFRDQVDDLPNDVLKTLVHPRIVGDVRDNWGKKV